MGKLTIFGDDSEALPSPAGAPASPQSPNATKGRLPSRASAAAPSATTPAASTSGFKRPLTPPAHTKASSPQPKRTKFLDDLSDDESTVSSSSKRPVNGAVNGSAPKVNGADKGKGKARDDKQQRKERAAALLGARQELPVYAGKAAIVQAIAENETVIVLGETGSGKTTQIPQFLISNGAALAEGRRRSYTEDAFAPRIAVTQPRRVAAISLATRVAEEMGVRLGGRCGYSVRFDDRSNPKTWLKFVTDGTLLQELLGDGLLAAYDIIILDEAHERTLRTDMLMGFLKIIQKRRGEMVAENADFPTAEGGTPRPARPLKIVVMSATLDAEKFSDFYGGAKILYIKGRQHPVQIMYTTQAQTDYVQAALNTILQTHKVQPPGDVLVFLAGQEDIESLQSQLQPFIEDIPSKMDQILLCPLYAKLPPGQQQKAFAKTPPNTRKIILATNVAETSITIPGVRYVIDTGVAKLKRFHEAANVEQLLVEPISRSSAQQRSGRAGREGPGKCFRLYTHAVYDTKLDATTPPEISRTSFIFTALHLIASGVDDLFTFPFMDPPQSNDVKTALISLFSMGAIGSISGKPGKFHITQLGRQMARLPLDPPLARALIEAFKNGCPREVIDLLAMLEQADTVLINTVATRDAANEAHAKFLHRDGDHMVLLNVLRAYDDVRDRPAEARLWCKDNFINTKAMSNVVDARNQLRTRCEQLGFDWKVSCGDAAEPILRSMLDGQALQVASKKPDGSLIHVSSRLPIKIHPSSSLYGRQVEVILYHELVHTSATYARICSRLRASWAQESLAVYTGRAPAALPR